MTSNAPPDRVLAGRYRIDGRIGRGGMGEVFHGYDERLDRPVAIKMLRQPTAAAGDDSPEALELLDAQRRDRVRFLREIRTAARLEHPGTPAVYDTGTEQQPDGTEQVWLVMQLLRGSTLETVLDEAVFDGTPSRRSRGRRRSGRRSRRCSPTSTGSTWCTATSSPPTS